LQFRVDIRPWCVVPGSGSVPGPWQRELRPYLRPWSDRTKDERTED